MFKRLILLITLFVSFSIMAESPRVYLLTSFATPKIWFHSKEWKAYESSEKVFRKTFEGSGYEQVILHEVDHFKLWNALHDPLAVAVFYISHGGLGQDLTDNGTVKIDNMISDINVGDLKGAFRNIHPNIRFVGVIGCYTQQVLNQLVEEGNYYDNPDLVLYGVDKKTTPKGGLKKALKEAASHISKTKKKFLRRLRIEATDEFLNFENHKLFVEEKGFEVKIKRIIPSESDGGNIPAVRVTLREKINLGIFPPGKLGETQELTVYIPVLEYKSIADLKIIMDSSENPFVKPKPVLGTFEITPSWDNGSYSVFANKKTGEPYGIEKRIFRYKGELDFNAEEVTYEAYEVLEEIIQDLFTTI